METQDYSNASRLTDRIDHQAAVVDTTNIIHALNGSLKNAEYRITE